MPPTGFWHYEDQKCQQKTRKPGGNKCKPPGRQSAKYRHFNTSRSIMDQHSTQNNGQLGAKDPADYEYR